MKRIFRRIFIVLECKEDEFEGIGVTYFAFMEKNFGCLLAMNLFEKRQGDQGTQY